MKLKRFSPSIRFFEEPHIEVGDSKAVPDPKMGWTLLGPLGKEDKIYEINLGLIGDSEGLENTKNLIERLHRMTYGKDKSFLHIDFPGLEKIRIKLVVRWVAEIDSESLKKEIENTTSLSERIIVSTRIFREKIKSLMERDPQPDVLFLVYPKIIDYYCIEQAIGHRAYPRKTDTEKKIEKIRSQHITLDKIMGIAAPSSAFMPTDLKSMIKAVCMEYNIPIQVLRPHTVEPYDSERPKREDDATTFWNLVVALFYKANHIPWRVRGLLEDTCYMGISFFRDRGDPSNVRTALAQFFSLDTEGYVFKGKTAIYDENNSPHISKDEAERLIKKAIGTYIENKGTPPRRIVVHKTSRFSDDEREGFKIGSEGIQKIDLIAFGNRNLKLLRWGTNPPIRGTMVRLPDQSILLYTFGYIPYLNVYPGPRVPSPLEILEHHGDTSIDVICQEILALTKLNWNSAKFCTKAPITISFAKRVGFILRNLPPDAKDLKYKFKFYM